MSRSIRQIILHLLARREHSQQEILQKLKAKGHTEADIRPIMADLVEAGLLSDQRFAENYLHFRRRKGYGPKRIQLELQARGITHEMIAELLEITDNAWFAEAKRVWQKHFKGKKPANFQHQAKQIRFLQYRGFTREQIEAVISKKTDSYEE